MTATFDPTGVPEFLESRPLLFTIAYELLGSGSDADDVVQETFLRWTNVDHATVENPRAYLVTMTTRLALNQLRTLSNRREEYIGNWIPEPLHTGSDIAEDVVLAESVSMAMLLVLETLNPTERAVFVLREVFSYSHAEIAAIVDKTEAAVRQIAHRARSHIAARRRRLQPDNADTREIVGAFFAAAKNGELETLIKLLSADVVQLSDGGGKAGASRRPIVGRAEVAKFAIGVARLKPVASIQFTGINGLPGLLAADESGVHTAIVFEISEGLIHGLYAIRNPDKLAGAQPLRTLSRQ